ncbi:MAG: RsfS/YbeB/iojap family protein, partial [Nitrospirota bacterium]
DHVSDVLTDKGDRPISIEGTTSGQWVLMDFGDVVGHIFRQDAREHYALERLWSDAKPLSIPEEKPEEKPEKPVAPKRRIIVRTPKARKSV